MFLIAAPPQVGSKKSPVNTQEPRPHQKLAAKGSSYSLGEGAVVQLPSRPEGGRLECDRIILADGTAIDLFDENEDQGVREKAHKRSRERQDEVWQSTV